MHEDTYVVCRIVGALERVYEAMQRYKKVLRGEGFEGQGGQVSGFTMEEWKR